MPFSKLRAPSAGFTLIELLVVITIMVLLLGGAIAGFLTFSDNQKVFAAAKEAQQIMRLAQSKAAANIYPEATGTCDQTDSDKYLQGYRVTVTATKFEVNAICGDSTPPFSKDTAVVKSYTVPTGVTVTGGNADFYTLNGGATNQTYTFTGGLRQYRFSVQPGGTVTDVIKL